MRRDDKQSDASYKDQCDSLLDRLAEDIEDYVARGDLHSVDRFLRVFLIEGVEPYVLAGILQVTQQYDELLVERRSFYERVRSEMSDSEAAQLLQGLP